MRGIIFWLAVVPAVAQVHHYEYVFPDGSMSVYDIDNGFSHLKTISLPTYSTRGSVAHAGTGMLYVSWGATGNGPGHLLKYDLVHDTIVWTRDYSFSIDSHSVSPDGKTIYAPDGEETRNGIWNIISAADGSVIGQIQSGGTGPHNTVINPAGTHVYMGPRYSPYLVEADAKTYNILQKIGPVAGTDGIRPFTINHAETLAFITATGKLGFQVGDIKTGKILYDCTPKGFKYVGSAQYTPSHGVSISPDEKEVYVLNQQDSYVHVFDITGLPNSAPKQVADIKLANKMVGEGWLHHSRDGRYVFVGDSVNVVDTASRNTVASLPDMAYTRKEIEIDFKQDGTVDWAMNNKSSIGVTSPSNTTSNAAMWLIQSASAQGSRVNSLSVAYPGQNLGGELLVAFVRMSTTTQTVTLSDTQSNPWTEAVSENQTADGHQIHIFYTQDSAATANGNTVTAKFSGTNNHPYLAIYEFGGWSPKDGKLAPTNSAQASGTAANPGSISDSTNNPALIFCGAGMTSVWTGSVTADSGYNMGEQDTSTSRAAAEWQVSPNLNGTVSCKFGLSSSVDWSAAIAAFLP